MADVSTAESDDRAAPRRGRRPAHGDPVVDRALRLLAAFDPTHRRMTLSTLSRRSDTPLSSTRRLAERLVAWGALERDAEGGYVIGLRLYEVASLAPRGLGLREVAMPYIEDLFHVTREHVQLAVLEGTNAVLVERRSRPGAIEVEYRVGGRLPLPTTAVGLVLLAFADPALQASVLADRPEGRAAVPDDEWPSAKVLAEVRRTGVAIVRRRQPVPLLAVAAPILRRQDDVVAALSLVVPARAADAAALEPVLRATARGISRAVRLARL